MTCPPQCAHIGQDERRSAQGKGGLPGGGDGGGGDGGAGGSEGGGLI